MIPENPRGIPKGVFREKLVALFIALRWLDGWIFGLEGVDFSKI